MNRRDYKIEPHEIQQASVFKEEEKLLITTLWNLREDSEAILTGLSTSARSSRWVMINSISKATRNVTPTSLGY